MEHAALQAAETKPLASRYPGFHSFKTIRPIHYRQRWLRDALIQATLDPLTIELNASSTDPAELPPPIEFSFRRRSAAGLGIVLVSQIETDIGEIVGDERVTVITRDELNREPVRTTTRTIWMQKRLPVDSAQRYRAIELIDRHGVASLQETIAVMKNLSADPVHQICSLIANGYLTIDLQHPMGPRSLLTLGPAGGARMPDQHWGVQTASAQH